MKKSTGTSNTTDPYLTMKSYLRMGNKLEYAVLIAASAIVAMMVLDMNDLKLTSAMQVNIMAAIAVTAFSMLLLIITLVSFKLKKTSWL